MTKKCQTIDDVVNFIGARITWGATELERAKAVYDWVLGNIVYDIKRREERHSKIDQREILAPDDVVQRQQGICTDIAGLYVVLCRRFGLKANYASVICDENNNRISHACAVIDLPQRPVQVDPTFKRFDAFHKEYVINEPDVLNGSGSQSNDSLFNQLPNVVSQTFGQKLMKKIKFSVMAGLLTYIFTAHIAPVLFYRHVQYSSGEQSATFFTKNGKVSFQIDSDAMRDLKETIFYTETAKHELYDHELLDLFINSDKDASSSVSSEEARESRNQARSKYRKSKQWYTSGW